MSTPDAIAVVDFGGQYCHLIATKLRALGVYTEIREPDDPVESFAHYRGIILSGSPSLSAYDQDAGWSRGVLDLDIPVLGLCFGHQEIAKHYGGEVEHAQREYGDASLHVLGDSPLFKGLEAVETVWMSHGDSVTRLPEGFVELGYSTSGASDKPHHNAAIRCESRRRYGLQFHPEVDDTPHGERMLANFAFEVCGLEPGWSVSDQVAERVERVRQQVAGRDVLLLVSGGVDSTVAARIFERALGAEHVKLLHIDNGLMRLDESRQVEAMFEGLGLGRSLHAVDASEDFLRPLKDLDDPEAKRRSIGETFVKVFERETHELGIGGALLGQGTIYPDTIETGGTRRADTIKTHHNRVPLIEEMIEAGHVVEPLSDLYKAEVRELGRALGIERPLLERHPFPGPGLGIRLACASADPEDFDREAMQAQLDRALEGTGLRGMPLAVRSVGVKADLRSYEHPVLLAGERMPWERLLGIASGIPKKVAGVNRCLLWLLDEEPRKLELVPARVTRERLDLLREIDYFVMQGLVRHGLMETVWQCPTVLVPLAIDGRGRELVVLRPVHSERAMTARPAWIGEELVAEIRDELRRYDQVSGLAIDATTKPPATIEWE